MTILDTIIARKKEEVAQRKTAISIQELERSPLFNRERISLYDSLMKKSSSGIIAEFKRKSPSKGIINGEADVVEVTKGYTRHGAACLSVLTDTEFFGGSYDDLIQARINPIPILRKDFIVDEYQLIEARSLGADVILLIAACLSPQEVKQLAQQARQLELEVLLELHDEEELGHAGDATRIIGINNRDLKTFSVDLDRSLRMAEQLPNDAVKVAESGISQVDTLKLFYKHGFRGFLIGENFMKEHDPVEAFARFSSEWVQTKELIAKS
ncbi:MAG: indole-3-glycerol phosphate synthase TrpC [Chitinophagales bacterium]|nr:indole-3-glycerol phosphate synthase TrpC [Chitinophagales bacterium]